MEDAKFQWVSGSIQTHIPFNWDKAFILILKIRATIIHKDLSLCYRHLG